MEILLVMLQFMLQNCWLYCLSERGGGLMFHVINLLSTTNIESIKQSGEPEFTKPQNTLNKRSDFNEIIKALWLLSAATPDYNLGSTWLLRQISPWGKRELPILFLESQE